MIRKTCKTGVIIVPEVIELAFGSTGTGDVFESADLKENAEVLIDLRTAGGFSTAGIEWLKNVAIEARKRYYQPYVIASRHLKFILDKTLIGRFVQVYTTLSFERGNLRSVENQEKDLLWGIPENGEIS